MVQHFYLTRIMSALHGDTQEVGYVPTSSFNMPHLLTPAAASWIETHCSVYGPSHVSLPASAWM